MGASVGVFAIRAKVFDEETQQGLVDILKYDHSRRAFMRFMQSKDMSELVNFSYELETLLAGVGNEELQTVIDKAEALCGTYVGAIIEKAPFCKFSYPFQGERFGSLSELTIALNILWIETKAYMGTYMSEFTESPYIEDSLIGMDTAVELAVPAGMKTPRGSFTSPRNAQSSPVSPQANSGKLTKSPPRLLLMGGKQLRHSLDADDTPMTLTAMSSLSAPGSPHGSKKMLPMSTFPDKFPKVLIIDDCETSSKIMKRMFQTAGHLSVETAANGSVGVEIFKVMMPSIIVVDVFMPVLGGVDTIRKLRDHQDEVSDTGGSVVTEVETTGTHSEAPIGRRSRGPSFGDQPQVIIIGMSAHSSQELQEDVFRAGADGFLLKPISIESLAGVVTRSLNTSPR